MEQLRSPGLSGGASDLNHQWSVLAGLLTATVLRMAAKWLLGCGLVTLLCQVRKV